MRWPAVQNAMSDIRESKEREKEGRPESLSGSLKGSFMILTYCSFPLEVFVCGWATTRSFRQISSSLSGLRSVNRVTFQSERSELRCPKSINFFGTLSGTFFYLWSQNSKLIISCTCDVFRAFGKVLIRSWNPSNPWNKYYSWWDFRYLWRIKSLNFYVKWAFFFKNWRKKFT